MYPLAAIRNRVIGTPAAFAGAYDAVPSIVAAYGPRRGLTAYNSYQYLLRRDSDNDEEAFGTDSAGNLRTDLIASWQGAANAYIVTMFDWSGNGNDASQTTAASQPLYVASGQNSRPVGRWDGTNDFLSIANAAPLSPSYISVVSVIKAVSYPVEPKIVSLPSNNGWSPPYASYCFGVRHGARVSSLFINTNVNEKSGTAVQVTGTAYVLSTTYDGTIRLFNNGMADGELLVGSAINSSTKNIAIGANNTFAASEFWSGDIYELIICNAALSTGDRVAAEAAANSYWAVY